MELSVWIAEVTICFFKLKVIIQFFDPKVIRKVMGNAWVFKGREELITELIQGKHGEQKNKAALWSHLIHFAYSVRQ